MQPGLTQQQLDEIAQQPVGTVSVREVLTIFGIERFPAAPKRRGLREGNESVRLFSSTIWKEENRMMSDSKD